MSSVPTPSTRVQAHIYLDRKQYLLLRRIADEQGVPFSELAREALANLLEMMIDTGALTHAKLTQYLEEVDEVS